MLTILTAAALASGAMPARQVGGVISESDYSASARAAGRAGTVLARFVIGTEGQVTSCNVISSSGDASLDSTTCSLIQERFRFRPAIDSEGKALEEERTQRVVWRSPPAPPPAEPAAEK